MRDVVIFQKYDPELARDFRVLFNVRRNIADQADDILGQIITRRGLRTENKAVLAHLKRRVILQREIQIDDMQRVEESRRLYSCSRLTCTSKIESGSSRIPVAPYTKLEKSALLAA